MNKAIHVLFAICALVAVNHVQCKDDFTSEIEQVTNSINLLINSGKIKSEDIEKLVHIRSELQIVTKHPNIEVLKNIFHVLLSIVNPLAVKNAPTEVTNLLRAVLALGNALAN